MIFIACELFRDTLSCYLNLKKQLHIVVFAQNNHKIT